METDSKNLVLMLCVVRRTAPVRAGLFYSFSCLKIPAVMSYGNVLNHPKCVATWCSNPR